MPKLILDKLLGIGRGIQMISDKVRARTGIIMNKICEDVDGRMGSLIKSFSPSASGWRIPIGPTILGPLRSCI